MAEQKEKIKYVIYARRSVVKSDKEEKVVSVDSQISEMKALAEKENLEILEVFQETISAKIPYLRKEFQKMILLIQSGKANGILCWKIDRLARNGVDEGTIKYLLQTGVIKNIRSMDRDWYPDDNAMLASVEFGVATQFSRDLSKNVKRGLRARLAQGVRPSNAPIGYRNSNYRIKGTEEILVDDERFPLVRQLFDYMLTGQHNPFQLVKVAGDIGLTVGRLKPYRGKKMTKAGIYHLLTNTFYYGSFEFPEGSGNWYNGKHKPMITKEEFDRVQFFLGRAGKAKPKTHSFAYTGLMKCTECGACITAEEKYKYPQNGKIHHYIYYHCTKRVDKNCTQKSVEEKVLDSAVLKYLSGLEIPKLFHEWAIETLIELHEKEKHSRNAILYKKQDQYNETVVKLDSLLELRMAGEITQEEYAKKKSILEQDKINLKQHLDSTDQRIDVWLKKAENGLLFAEHARSEFEIALKNNDIQKKKKIFSILGYNHLLKDKILDIQTENPILLIKEAAFVVKSISDRLEPPKTLEEQGQIKQNYSKNTPLCGIGESNACPEFGKLLFYH